MDFASLLKPDLKALVYLVLGFWAVPKVIRLVKR